MLNAYCLAGHKHQNFLYFYDNFTIIMEKEFQELATSRPRPFSVIKVSFLRAHTLTYISTIPLGCGS